MCERAFVLMPHKIQNVCRGESFGSDVSIYILFMSSINNTNTPSDIFFFGLWSK